MSDIITTDRLRLREMTHGDLDFVAGIVGDPETMRFYPQVYDRDEARGWIDRQLVRYERDGHGLWLVDDRASGEPRGMIGLMMQNVDGEALAEVGYLVHRRYWRQGIASEAAAATRNHAFEVRGYPRIISLIRPVNEPSQAVARSIGETPWKTTIHADLEHIVYTLTREDHEARVRAASIAMPNQIDHQRINRPASSTGNESL